MALFTFALRLLAVAISIVWSQCPTPREIDEGDGEFQSPNFGGEYGKKADCTWRFSSSSWTKYALKLEVKVLRLYLPTDGSKVCVHGSYNLSIDGALIDCDKFSRESNGNTFCHAYYDDDACRNVTEVTSCEVSEKNLFPVEVKYNSDGRKVSDHAAEFMWGFKIGYELIQCPGSMVRTTYMPTPERVQTPVSTFLTSRHETKEVSTMLIATDENKPDNVGYRNDPIAIGGAFAGGVGLTILVVAIVYVVKRCQSNRNQKAKGQVEAAPANRAEDQAYQTYEQVNNPNATNNFTLEGNSAYEATNDSGRQEITLKENPGYDNPNLSNAQQIASDYESVNYNASHLYERPK